MIAVNFKVHDVSSGRRFYGPEGPYGLFAGRDASRALAQGNLESSALPTEWDDLEDLTEEERASLCEWEGTFSKYPVVGKLVKEQ